jgi:A/G-specific adenine glycosylase
VQERLKQIYPDQAGAFTQSLMELGATLCGPNWAPRCEECPCAGFCRAYAAGTAEKLPVKSPKKEKKQEQRTVFLLSCDGRYALSRRPEKGLLAGLWEFPNVTGALSMQEGVAVIEAWGLRPLQLLKKVQRQHIFTHIRWEMTGLYVEVKEPLGDFVWYTADEIEKQAALPTAFRQFWEEIKDV